jgi:hypothetical protein
MSVTVATFLCGRCVAERRPRPGVLGRVTRRSPGGPVVWHGHDPRWARLARRAGVSTRASQWRDGRVLWHPLGAGTVPELIRTHCRYHGPGHVGSAVVRSGRGTVVVEPT